jgi:hypothetical protein
MTKIQEPSVTQFLFGFSLYPKKSFAKPPNMLACFVDSYICQHLMYKRPYKSFHATLKNVIIC